MPHSWIRRIATAAALAAFGSAAVAQGSGNTTLVLDASGSMWGQIDGEAKITIAQRAVTDLLTELPDDAALGLVAYGHRERGQCGDIETLVAPGTGTRSDVLNALNAISPRGKTPLSDAVLHAAEGLAYTEDRATVILISDGIETCDADPCAVAQRLEETGIDFTAHVIGFDVDGEAAEQLSCLANATGGQFLAADDATGLADALQQITVEAPPTPVQVTFQAEIAETGALIETGLVWSVSSADGDSIIIQNQIDASPVTALLPGSYRATALWTETEVYQDADVAVAADADAFTVTLTFAAPVPQASVTPPDTATAGDTVPVDWTGPNDDGDFITVATTQSDGRAYVNYAYTADGAPVGLQMPILPGDYVVRYVNSDTGSLATAPITVLPVSADVRGPETAPVGSTASIAWDGPAYDGDYISVAAIDAPDDRYINYVYASANNGNPAALTMPGEPGSYEIRYVASQDYVVLARSTITVTDTAASIGAPETANMGSALAVTWTGPGLSDDFLTVARPDQDPANYVNWTRLGDDGTATLTMPPDPGFYELRYILGESKRVLASRPLTVIGVTAELTAPDTAMAGSQLSVGWTGPDNDGDFLTVARPDQPPKEYENWERLDGSDVILVMPDDAGLYELRYILGEGGRTVVSQPITITPAIAVLDAPDGAVRGSGRVTVNWTGPNGPRDYISLATPDAEDTRYEDYVYTRQGSEVTLPVPDTVGQYELRYVSGSARRVIERIPFAVTNPVARLAAPGAAQAGATLQIAWQGPGDATDAIAIVPKGGDASTALVRVPVSAGNPIAMDLPTTAGDYEFLYLIAGDGTPLTRQDITLTD